MKKKWTFHPAREFTVGAIITGGDIFGMVEENELINHAIMMYPGKSGRITVCNPFLEGICTDARCSPSGCTLPCTLARVFSISAHTHLMRPRVGEILTLPALLRTVDRFHRRIFADAGRHRDRDRYWPEGALHYASYDFPTSSPIPHCDATYHPFSPSPPPRSTHLLFKGPNHVSPPPVFSFAFDQHPTLPSCTSPLVG